MNILGHGYSKEIRFQDMYNKQEILDMIKDHSYKDNLRRFMASGEQLGAHASQHENNNGDGGDIERKREFMFRKEVTPNDIGKLNRLVIPKKYAERHFPLPEEVHEEEQQRQEVLVFKDEEDRSWEFAYTFWKSSGRYVLTMGWKGFVKDKYLRAGDILRFERCS